MEIYAEVFVILLVCIALTLGFFARKPIWEDPQSTPADRDALQAYETRSGLFVNSAELALFSALNRHKSDGFHVMSKIRLEDVLQVRRDIKNAKLRWKYRGRIKSRHVDFVLCDQAGRYLCALELDGSSHTTRQSQMVDAFKDSIFQAAGLKLYRVKTGIDFDLFARKLWLNYSQN